MAVREQYRRLRQRLNIARREYIAAPGATVEELYWLKVMKKTTAAIMPLARIIERRASEKLEAASRGRQIMFMQEIIDASVPDRTVEAEPGKAADPSGKSHRQVP